MVAASVGINGEAAELYRSGELNGTACEMGITTSLQIQNCTCRFSDGKWVAAWVGGREETLNSVRYFP